MWEGKAWPQPLGTYPLHSPQLVWVDVDPRRQAAAARDKAQKAAPVLWLEKEISARTNGRGGSITSTLPLHPTSGVRTQAPNCLLTLTVGEAVQRLPEVLHPCVRWLKVFKAGWWGQGQNSSLGSEPTSVLPALSHTH